MKIAIIGGGPSGMLCAIFAKRNNPEASVTIFEKNEKLGKKLYITGKGRCNITNLSDEENLIQNTVTNPYFMYSSYYSFNSFATVDFFNDLGLRTKVERGNRVFPTSDKSSDVIKVLANELNKLRVSVKLSSNVESVRKQGDKFELEVNNKAEVFDKLVIATGGLSYPQTGSTGDGFKYAETLGHTVTKLNPSLVALRVAKESELFNVLQGLTLKNVGLNAQVNGKSVYKNQGELLFTHFGITGPLVLSASSYLAGKYNQDVKVFIDLKPALTYEKLDERVLKDFELYKNKELKNALVDLLPQKLIPVIIKYTNLDETKKVNEITKEERKKLLDALKNLTLIIKSDFGFGGAVITKGGVSVDEIDPSTMESKLVPNLYFIGEVIDVDCLTGGYNLQVAYSTAFLCGNNLN